jgi:hypothetical protein
MPFYLEPTKFLKRDSAKLEQVSWELASGLLVCFRKSIKSHSPIRLALDVTSADELARAAADLITALCVGRATHDLPRGRSPGRVITQLTGHRGIHTIAVSSWRRSALARFPSAISCRG